MKKNNYKTLLTAVVFCAALAACSDIERSSDDRAITFSAVSDPMTKGYVQGETMDDTPFGGLHGGSAAAPRALFLTAWLYTQPGGEEEYFRNEPFFKNANGETSADDGYNLWHHNPPLYWPMGGRMDFLAYSASAAFPSEALMWSYGNSTDRLAISVGADRTQDDIMFACALNRSCSSSGNVPLRFYHAQAWLEFILSADASTSGSITIDRIELRDIYTSGMLTVEHPFGTAQGSWSFRGNSRRDTPVDDSYGVFGTAVTVGPKYCDMLLPEQDMKNIVLYYTLDGSDAELVYEWQAPGSMWDMGKKYIYEISFSPNGISVLPLVRLWNYGGETEIEL